MKKILFTLICLQSVFTFGQAPAIEWQRTYGGSLNDGVNDMIVTPDNGYIIAGYTASNDGDVSLNKGTTDAWVIKLDVSGNIVWEKTYGGSKVDAIYSIIPTDDDGYVFAAVSHSNDGDVSLHYGSELPSDYWIVKLDEFGNILWEKSMGGTGIDTPVSIKQTPDGGYIVAGHSSSDDFDVSENKGDADCWLVKLDSSGNILWEKSYGGSLYDYATDLQLTSDNGYILAAYVRSNDGDVTGHNGGTTDYWIVKLDEFGNILWEKTLGGTNSDVAISIGETTDGNFIVAGYTFSNDGDVTANYGGADFWIVKLNSTTGNIIWEKTFGGSGNDIARDVKQSSDGGFVVVGFSNSSNGDFSENYGDDDWWVMKLDGLGNVIWKKILGGSMKERIYTFQLTSGGSIILSGQSKSNDGDLTENKGGDDIWVVKLEGDCSPVSHTISETACTSFTWADGNGETYTSSTSVSHTFVGGAANGCDSIVTLNLTINQPTNSSLSVTECGSYTWSENNQTYTSTGSYTYVVPNANNCDSTITLNLTINQPTSSSVSVTECGSYTWSENNQTYTSSGAYTHVVPNANNCDSTITLNLTINQPTSSSVSITECGSYTWPVNNQTYTSSGSYTHIIPNVNNCDSTITLNLTINNVDNTVSVSGITLTANQAGASYQWVDCDNGNAPISGETAQSFTPTTNGNYAVEVTANGCTEISSCVAVNSVGIDEVWYAEFAEVYPNPNDGLFTINSTQTFNNAVVEIYSALGQLVYSAVHSGDKITINLNEQPTGIYILKVNNQQNLRVIKL